MWSVLSSDAPRLLAVWPPHGSMFSLNASAQLKRSDEVLIRRELVIDLGEELVALDLVRARCRSRRRTRRARGSACGVPSGIGPSVTTVRVVDGDEVVGVDVEPLEGQEVEGPVLLDRPAERAAELLLPERRLLAVDRGAGRVELLEMLLGVERLVAEEAEQRCPASRLVPLLVTMFTTPPEALPNSAEYELVSTWNSRTASWLKVARTAPTVASLLSSPSTVMLFERARWPAKVRPEVADAPCCGVRSVVTPGVMTENEMKLRPLIGRLSICCCETTLRRRSAACRRAGTAPTVTCSCAPAMASVKGRSTAEPRASTMPSRSCGVNPWSSTRTV